MRTWAIPVLASILVLGVIAYSPISFADDDDDDDDNKEPKTLESECAKKTGFDKLLCEAILALQLRSDSFFDVFFDVFPSVDSFFDVFFEIEDRSIENEAELDAILEALSVVPELCDGVDNNVNGETDEDFTTLGDSCTVGVGVCQNTGVRVCADGGDDTVCSVTPGTPVTEVCSDGLDNDCDGTTDENARDRCINPSPRDPSTTGFCQRTGDTCTDFGPNASDCPIIECVPP